MFSAANVPKIYDMQFYKSDIFSNVLRYVERLSAGASIIQMAALSEKLKTFVIICLTDDVLDANQQKI